MTIKAKVDGFDSLDEKLKELAMIADVVETDAAPRITNLMRNTAVDLLTKLWGAVDTGALRNSVEGSVDIVMRETDARIDIGITASSDHLKYVEFGTGNKGSAVFTAKETGETYVSEGVTFKPKDRWFQHNPDYQGEFGKNNDPRKGFQVDAGVEEWIPRFAQAPRPFMRPALYENIPEVKNILEETVGRVFS
jgi:HK97 gp10 family phage protein